MVFYEINGEVRVRNTPTTLAIVRKLDEHIDTGAFDLMLSDCDGNFSDLAQLLTAKEFVVGVYGGGAINSSGAWAAKLEELLTSLGPEAVSAGEFEVGGDNGEEPFWVGTPEQIAVGRSQARVQAAHDALACLTAEELRALLEEYE